MVRQMKVHFSITDENVEVMEYKVLCSCILEAKQNYQIVVEMYVILVE